MQYRFETHEPIIEENVFVAASADLIGQVELRSGASVWFNAVLRGDNDRIRIGRDSSIQDGTVIHTDAGLEVVVEDRVTVGHRVVLHGCHIGENSLVGINSVILNGARVGPWCLIGANTLITSGKEIPERSLVMGSPAKVIRPITEEEAALLEESWKSYRDKVRRYRDHVASIER